MAYSNETTYQWFTAGNCPEGYDRTNTETHCHCGSAMHGSDHCPNCGCEEHESYCTVSDKDADDVRPGDHTYQGATVTEAVYSDPCCNSVGRVTMTMTRNDRTFTVTVEADRKVRTAR